MSAPISTERRAELRQVAEREVRDSAVFGHDVSSSVEMLALLDALDAQPVGESPPM